jgi:2-phospho-L-lactate/phosphoenolpyruvate guanylyltransferase
LRTVAILPVKRFALAKQRLGASVADPLRRELARAMVGDVLLALAQTGAIDRTIVVTREPEAADAARSRGSLVVADPAEQGQSAAAALGVQRALADGAERVLLVPGDCPALDPADLESLLAGPAPAAAEPNAPDRRDASGHGAADGPTGLVVIVPDRHGSGTNALVLTPPEVIAPSFGPGSCERHRALAVAAGAAWRIARPVSLLLDIDTGDDLQALRHRLSGGLTRATGTRALLDEMTSAAPAL